VGIYRNPVVEEILRQGRGRPRKLVKAALEVGRVEKNFTNTGGGDADSSNWRQERASVYGPAWARTGGPLNLRASVRRFYQEAAAHNAPGKPAWMVAADTQRPRAEYRTRYRDVRGEAARILAGYGGNSGGGGRNRGGDARPGGAARGAAGAQGGSVTIPGIQGAQNLPQGSQGIVPLLQALSQQKTAPASMGLQSPSFAAGPAVAGQSPLSGGGPQPKQDISGLLQAIQTMGGNVQLAPGSPGMTLPGVGGGGGRSGGRGTFHPGKTLVVGDSLAVGTAPRLAKMMGGRVIADAKVGRPSPVAVRRLRAHLQQGGVNRIVFDAGTNDMSAGELRKSLGRVRNIAGNVPIYVATVNGPHAAAKNQVLRSTPGVNVVNWARRSARHPGLIGGDGIHATSRGYQRRAAQFVSTFHNVEGAPAPRQQQRDGDVRLGRVSIAPGANYAGRPINKPVVQFVRQVAGMLGRRLTIGTGTHHDRLTVNGTVSDHYSGNAADVPLTGRLLIRAGQDALIAAGMPAAKARRITGGGFNYGGWQIIFNTNAPGWGDHLTHLHIGRRT
jgi:hypothetical protein